MSRVALLFAVASGCITPDDLLDGQGCPCIEGWRCDETQTPNVCVPGEGQDAGTTDAAPDTPADTTTDSSDAPAPDAADDTGTIDAGVPGPPPPLSTRCWVQPVTCDWSVPNFRFVEADVGNFTDYEAANVAFSPDACTLMHARVIADNFELYSATRAGPRAEFRAPAPIVELAAPTNEDAPSLAPGELELFVASDRGPSGLRRVHRFARNEVTDPWEPDGVRIPSLEIDGSTSWEPRLAPHGLRLYVALSDSIQWVRVLERASLDGEFGEPEFISFRGLTDGYVTNRPSVTHDGRILVAIQQDPLTTSTRRAFYVTRPHWNAEWGEVRALPVEVGADGMRDVGVSPDGCEIVARDTTGQAALLRYQVD